jgi:hypothetical protein
MACVRTRNRRKHHLHVLVATFDNASTNSLGSNCPQPHIDTCSPANSD